MGAMTSISEKQQRDEQQHIALITRALTERHTDTPAAEVAGVVEAAYHRFDGQPVRDFVPLLVERRAQAQLGVLATALPTSLDKDSAE